MSFVNRMDQTVAKYMIGIQMKKWWWSPFFSMADTILQDLLVLNGINKDEGDESLSLLGLQRDVVNAIFLKYSMEGRLSSRHVETGNIPSEVCYNDTKNYQVQSENRRIQNPFKHLRWNVFA